MGQWRKTIFGRLPMYLFPFTLVTIEFVFRTLSLLNTSTFIGPTLASVGVGFVLPLTVRRPLTVERLEKIPQKLIKQLEQLQKSGVPVQYMPPSETIFINLCWSLVLVLTLFWILSIYFAIELPHAMIWFMPDNYYPGFINYVFGVVLSEIREAV